uniref:Putative phosphoribosyltransferase n=1 Tax=Desulfovibrio sp. U5L TaxID=596152 RepID=I2PWG7_9BACT
MAARVLTHPPFDDRPGVFPDRPEAGLFLGEMLAASGIALREAVVLAIPNGGVPVGLAVARRLRLPCDVVVVRKLQIPGNTEAGFGAVNLDGEVVLNTALVAELGLGPPDIEAEAARVGRELAAREALLRGDRPLPPLAGRTVILVDDGLASGYTMLAAIGLVRQRDAAVTVVAAPTAPRTALFRLADVADWLVVPQVCGPGPFAVARAYRHWRDLRVEETAAMLGAFARERPEPPGAASGPATTKEGAKR